MVIFNINIKVWRLFMAEVTRLIKYEELDELLHLYR
jgi:hypothetical protein